MKRIKKCANFGGIFTSTISPVINGIGGVLDDTLSKQGVNQFKIDDPNTETDNTVVMRCGGKARPKCWLGAAIGATTSLASGLIGGAASRKAARKAAALRNRQTMIQDMQGRDKQLNALYSTYLNNNDNEEDLIYRRGGTATQHPRRRGLTDAQYYSIMKQVAIDNWRKWGDASPAAAFNRAINSNAYDYRGYYNKYPNSRANADTHWTDEFKGVGEKTFSDQSKYSGVRHPKYNPNGIRGGHWYGANEDMFVPSIQQLVERSKFRRGGMTYKPTKQPDALDRLGNWVNKNRKSNIIAKGLYSLGFDRGTIKRTKSDIKELVNRGILPDFTSDNGLLSAAGPLSGPVRSASAISKGVQNANKIRQAANASKATQAVKQSAKVEGSNVMKYVQQRANPNSIYNGRVNTIRMRTPFGQLRNRLANRNQLNALEEKAMAERYRKDPSKFIQDLVGGNIKTEAAIRRSQAAARSARQASKAAAKARKPTFSQTNTVNGGRVPVRRPAEQTTRFNGNTSTGTVNGGRIQVRQPATQPASTAQQASTAKPAFSDAPVAPNVPTTHVAPVNPATPTSSTTQAKHIYDIIKNTKAYKTLYRLSKSEDFPKVVGYTALGVPLALGSAYGAYKLLNNTNNSKSNNINNKTNFKKLANNLKAKAQSQQVSNNTVQVAKQTPNDSIIIKDKVQPGEVVHRDSIYKANDGESYVKVGDKTGNTWVNIKNVPANTPAVSNNKTTDSRNLGKSQTQQTKAAAQTIQRKGRSKSRVVSNRTNNIRQNINFEPIDDTINGYSQVEDIQGRSYDEYKADVDAEAEARRQEIINDLLTNYNYEDRNTTDEMRYGGKARSKRRVPIKITDGGVAQRIGNNTFLLRGSSHEQVNPSGQTGIGIKVGNNEIEAEGGEVAQRVGNALRIFSAQPMIYGVSPAQAVEAGANKNRIFAIQEALKRKGYKCGGRVKLKCGGRAKLKPGGKVNPIFKYNDYAGIEYLPNSNTGISSGTYNNGNLSLGQAEKTIFPKGFVSHDYNNIGYSKTNTTPIDNWWNRNGMSVNSSDWIGLGTDLAGSLALGAFNANAYKNLKYDYKLPNYVDEIPVAFDTTYHNGAQRATVERNRLNAQKIIANNTSSANTAVQRMQQSNADAMMETNKLWDEKANKEVELRNMAAQNEQQVRARNAAARNQYYQNVAEIQNKRIDAENANRLARSNAWVTSLQGLQGAANNFLNSTRQRYEDENALMATIAAGDAATPYRMMAFGTQFGPRVINAVRAMNNVEGMKDPGAAPVRSNYSNDADYSTARSKWEAAMKNYEYWKQRNQFLSNYDSRGRLIRRR